VTVCGSLEPLITNDDLDIQERRAFNFVQKLYGVCELDGLESAIQHFVNKIKNEPERWEGRPDQAVLESLQAIKPCD